MDGRGDEVRFGRPAAVMREDEFEEFDNEEDIAYQSALYGSSIAIDLRISELNPGEKKVTIAFDLIPGKTDDDCHMRFKERYEQELQFRHDREMFLKRRLEEFIRLCSEGMATVGSTATTAGLTPSKSTVPKEKTLEKHRG